MDIDSKDQDDARIWQQCIDLMETTSLEDFRSLASHMPEQDFNRHNKDRGNTLLHWAIYHNRNDIAQFLIREKGVDTNIANLSKGRSTPLHIAILKRNLEIVKCLVKEGSAEVEKQDGQQHTPLTIAFQNKQYEIALWLIEEGEVRIDGMGNNGYSALHDAAEHGRLDIARCLIEKRHANINAKNNDGVTPLKLATTYRHHEVVKYLLQQGADVSLTDSQEPIDIAIQEGDAEMVTLLNSYDAPARTIESTKDGKVTVCEATEEGKVMTSVPFPPTIHHETLDLLAHASTNVVAPPLSLSSGSVPKWATMVQQRSGQITAYPQTK